MSEPPPLPPGWRREKVAATPEHEPLSVDRIVAAALELVDRDGLEALSMRRLGVELGAGATTLYWHVRNKDELLDLLLDEIFLELEVPDPSLPWRERVTAGAISMRAMLLRHRNLAMVLASRPTTGPNALSAMDTLLGIVRQAGFSDARAVDAVLTIVNFTGGCAILEAAGERGVQEAAGSGGPPTIEAQSEQVVAFIGSLPKDRFPNLVPLAAYFIGPTDHVRFAYGLERILDGIEAEVAQVAGD